MNKCPKCGAARIGGRGGLHHHGCGSWCGNGECDQSDFCRIRELEAQLASAKQLTADRIEDAFREAVELTDRAWKANDAVDVEGMWRHSEARRGLLE